MPSADFCAVIPAPHGAGGPDGQPCRSPRVLRTHFHAYACRIYVMAFCASIGLRRLWTAYPAMPPRIRFLFVRPAFCLGLPSDSQSPATPLPSANTSPCRVCRGLSPPSRQAHHHSEPDSASHGATRHAWRTQRKTPALGRGSDRNCHDNNLHKHDNLSARR